MEGSGLSGTHLCKRAHDVLAVDDAVVVLVERSERRDGEDGAHALGGHDELGGDRLDSLVACGVRDPRSTRSEWARGRG